MPHSEPCCTRFWGHEVEKSLADVHSNLSDAEAEVASLEAASLIWPKGEKAPPEEEKRLFAMESSENSMKS